MAPLLAQALLQSGQTRKLISEFSDQSLADPPAMSTLLQHLSMAYLAQGNVTEAKAAAVRALQLTPESEGAILASVRTKLAGGFIDDAMATLDQLLVRSPKAVKALQLKAEALLTQNKVAEAEPLLAQVLALDPAHYDARALLVRLAFSQQRVDAAAKLVDEMPAAVGNRPQGRLLKAQVALAKNDPAKAKELALPLLKVMPDYLPLLRLASGAHQQLGELADAENLLNQALKL
ncbi:MAG: tetratricopeptide repeat protein, partial [Rubrivivax sp.]